MQHKKKKWGRKKIIKMFYPAPIKPARPRQFDDNFYLVRGCSYGSPYIIIGGFRPSIGNQVAYARACAAWLNRAADWLEANGIE